MNDEQMTIKEVARSMEVDEKTVRRWIKSGELRAIKDIFGRYQITRSDLDDFIEKRQRRYNPEDKNQE